MVVILGAGLAGLSTAYHLRRAGRRSVALCEREARPGGLCRSESVDGFTFDRTGHFLHLRDPAAKRLASRWLGDELATVTRSSWIFSHGVYTRYPFQTNTYGLPIAVVKECLLGYIQAQYGKIELPADPADGQSLPEPRRSFERWVYETFGPGIARHFMIPYNDKLWGVHPRFLTTEWMGRYVPPAPIEQVVEGALTDQTASVGYNATFRYPRRGGIETFVGALARRAGPVQTGRQAVEVDVRRRRVRFADGSDADYEALVSTLPLPELCKRLRPLPAGVADAAARLNWSSLFAVNLGLRGAPAEPGDSRSAARDLRLTNQESKIKNQKSGMPPRGIHWAYVPERRYRFYRMGCYSNAAASMAPPGHSACWAEFSHNAHRPIDRKAARRAAIEGLKEMGFLRSRRDIAAEWLLDIPYAYVTHDAHHGRATRTIHRYLQRHGIHSVGRYGRWEYSSMEDALVGGRETAERLLRDT